MRGLGWAALAATASLWAGSAQAYVVWSGTVPIGGGGAIPVGFILSPAPGGLYTFHTTGAFSLGDDFGVKLQARHFWVCDDGTCDFGNDHLDLTFAGVGLPEPALTLTSDGFSLRYDLPPDSATHGCCLGPPGAETGYLEYWDYRASIWADLRFTPESASQNYTLNYDPIPEPATWAMMIAGFGLAGAALRRRRVVAA